MEDGTFTLQCHTHPLSFLSYLPRSTNSQTPVLVISPLLLYRKRELHFPTVEVMHKGYSRPKNLSFSCSVDVA